MPSKREQKYLEIILAPIRVCAHYKPKIGKRIKNGASLTDFQNIYRTDPFYNWFGLFNPLMYAAHKAAGGMTSIYRQIGIGSENLFKEILKDELGLNDEQVNWSYTIPGAYNKQRKLKLDGRIKFDDVRDIAKRERVRIWMKEMCEDLDVNKNISDQLQGIVFEVRQGYKSKDSKRQNADIANASHAYTQAYLPCVVVLSMQIDEDISARYRSEKWAILTGKVKDTSPKESTYEFLNEIIGFDLASFFDANSARIRDELDTVLESLLKVE